MIFHFLSSVYFAALLIAVTAGLVIAATLIEGHYGAHEAAAELIYHSWMFNLLLSGFFINILCSTLKRWPFQRKHIPFILTHLGLLMVIAGTAIKNIWGLQGAMHLVEGGASSEVSLSGTQAIHVDGASYPIRPPLDFTTAGGMSVRLKHFLPHARLEYNGWNRLKEGTFKLWNEEYLVQLRESAQEAYVEHLQADEPVDLAWGEHPTLNGVPLTGYFRHIDPQKSKLLHLQNKNQLVISPQELCLIRQDGTVHIQKIAYDRLYAQNNGLQGYRAEALFPEHLFLSVEERLDQLAAAPFMGSRSLLAPLGFSIVECTDAKCPCALSLECSAEGKQENISLFFSDPLPWPVFGKYLMQFGPHTITIPHTLRLRQARKFHADYEADVVVDGKLFTLRMNQVLETQDGIRFYLSSMSNPPDDAKQVTLAVNYDPVRKSLTYPGAFLVILGASLLFFFKTKEW